MQLVKVYGAAPDGPKGRYSPADCTGSKRIENHASAVALHFMFYNFAKIHKSLRVTPAMEVGLTNHVWSVAEIAALVPEPVAKKRGSYKPRQTN